MTTTPDTERHCFANGIQVYRRDLLPLQLERYAEHGNLHEPVEEFWLQRLLTDCDRQQLSFLDIGAALGYYSLLVRAQRTDARIYAVDPNPGMADRFWQTLALNNVGAADVTFLPLAVYPGKEQVRLALKTFSSHVVEQQEGRSADTTDMIAVETVDLAGLLALIPGPIDIAKMDIQGAELAVLSEAADMIERGQIRSWIVGTHSPHIHKTLLGLFARHHDILFEDPAPDGQPDGIIVARHREASRS